MKFIKIIILSIFLVLTSCSKQLVEGTKKKANELISIKTTGKDRGLCLGVVGFNSEISKSSVSNLNHVSIPVLKNFVSSLKSSSGTLLYNAVDETLDNINAAEAPSDLSNLILITFTDGLDQGSVMLSNKYKDEAQYSDALYDRIRSTQKNGASLQALSIGLKGPDVTNYQRFRENLKNLASDEKYVTEVNSMNDVKAKLDEIADSLVRVSFDVKQTVKITMPGVGDGTRVRFVLDGSNKAEESNMFIEGTFNLSERSLNNIVYSGLTCENPGHLLATFVDGIFVTYTFEGIRTNSGKIINIGNIKEFVESNGFWQINSEFLPSNNAETTADVNQKNALVMLVVDCSSSLQDDFDGLKDAVIGFVDKLATWNDPKKAAVILNQLTNSMEVDEVNVATGLNSEIKESKKTIKVGKVSFDMVYVEGGNFKMVADEKGNDIREMNVGGFYMGTTEVTGKLWTTVMGFSPEHENDDKPVSNVSWEDCQKFIKKLNKKTSLNFRIPTEVEWVYAACGGVKNNHFVYSGSNDFMSVAWTLENSNDQIQKVAKKAPNALGIYDMSGNVYEWCEYDPLSEEVSLNSQRTRVIRGGCYKLPSVKSSIIKSRDYFQIKEKDVAIGLRLAL